jgi:hypothetical protein
MRGAHAAPLLAVSVLLRAVMDEREEHLRQESIKLYFECFKHLTTLNTATALVVLALHRDTPLSSLAATAILAFSVSLITSLYAMVRIPGSAFVEVVHGFSPSWLLAGAAITFIAGTLAAFVAVFLIYGELSTLRFWMGAVIVLYGLALGFSPILKRAQERLSWWRNR